MIAAVLVKIYFKFFRGQKYRQNQKIIHNHDFIASQQDFFQEKIKNFFDITTLWNEKVEKTEKKQKQRIKSLSKCDDKLNLELKETKNAHFVKKIANVNAPPFVKSKFFFFCKEENIFLDGRRG